MSEKSETNAPRNLRIDLSISDGQPELLKDVLATPRRQRGERLRFLAQLGLVALQGGRSGLLGGQEHRHDGELAGGDAGADKSISVPERPITADNRTMSHSRRRAMANLGQSLSEPDVESPL